MKLLGGQGPEGPAVTEKGQCTRIMYAGADQHTVKQVWVLHRAQGVRLITTLVDERVRGRVGKESTSYSAPNEIDLSKLAREKASEIMAGKRKAAEKNGVPRAGSGHGADCAISCPVIEAFRAKQPQQGRRTRTTTTSTSSRAKPSADQEVRYHTAVYGSSSSVQQ